MPNNATTSTNYSPKRLESRGILRVTLGAVALLTVLLAAFAWPTSELEPRSLPLAVAAPSTEAASAVETQLASAFGEDGVEVIDVNDREAAINAIQDREAYGAFVVGTDGVEVLTATVASPVVAQMLDQAAQSMGSQPEAPSTSVSDVAPASDGDPQGAVFSSGALPLALGGILVGAMTALLLGRVRNRLATAFLASAGAGLALAGVLQGWLGVLSGSYWANASVIALGILAVALPAIGLHRCVGRAGIGIMALLVVLLGNPNSGVASAPELLPLGWLGQLLPPGATGTALRGTAYFDGAGVATALIVLVCWAGVGLALALLPRMEPKTPQAPVDQRPVEVPASSAGNNGGS